jgi:HlyD family secretion protein
MSLAALAKQPLALIRREGRARPPAVLQEAASFQNDIDAIVDEAAPRWMRTVTHLLALLLVTMLVISSFTHIETIVRASGHLIADRPTILLQPMERSIVRELKVKVGDTVKKGQVLATLDPTFSQADLETLRAQRSALDARIRRLETELGGAPLPRIDPNDADMALQATLYRERQAQYASRLRAFDEEIQRNAASLRTIQDETSALKRQIAVAKNVERIRGNLLEEQLGSKLQYLDAQNSSIRAEREYQSAVNRATELRHEIEAKRAERESFVNQWRGELLEGLARDRSELARVTDGLAKARRLGDFMAVTAPEDGVVLDVAMRSTGSVVREAEPLVSLLPVNAGLIVDVLVASDDVGYMRAGDKVAVKVDAFPYQRHGMLHGRVRSIGERAFTGGSLPSQEEMAPPSNRATGSFHRVQVELTKTALDRLPEGARLIPGMTVTAEVEVGQRTIISYILYPIIRGLDESIREP